MALLSLVACGPSGGSGATGPAGSGSPGSAQVAQGRLRQSWVIFSKRELVVDRLEVPIDPPVIVGSSPTGGLLTSSDPSVVSVTPQGALVAHRAGTAVIEAPADAQRLAVRVITARQLVLQPAGVELTIGRSARLTAVADGLELPPGAVQWGTTDPSVATVVGGEVRGVASGVARIAARFGGVSAECAVRVGLVTRGEVRVLPFEPSLTLGSATQFRLVSAGGALPEVAWSSTNPRVLEHLRNGLFRAVAPGEVQVCAATRKTTSCTKARVQP